VGADSLFYIDAHVEQMSGYSSFGMWKQHIRTEHLYAKIITESHSLDNLCILCPDVGAIKRAKTLVKCIKQISNKDLETAIINKERLNPNEVSSLSLIGDVKGKDCIIVDDMVDTGGTMFKAVNLLKEKGAKQVWVFATHGLFSQGFYDNLDSSNVDKFFITNTLKCRKPKREENTCIQRIDLSEMLANFINKTFEMK
jgi:ribose-phosphate pyrophosphokinase